MQNTDVNNNNGQSLLRIESDESSLESEDQEALTQYGEDGFYAIQRFFRGDQLVALSQYQEGGQLSGKITLQDDGNF